MLDCQSYLEIRGASTTDHEPWHGLHEGSLDQWILVVLDGGGAHEEDLEG